MTTTQLDRDRQTTTRHRPHPEPTPTLTDRLRALEALAASLAHRFGHVALRVALGTVFVWFGALKVTGDSPVAELVTNTVNWIPLVEGWWFVPFLGAVEVALGAALMLGVTLRFTLPILFAHLVGTFLAVVVQPALMFTDGNLLLLTTEGEFVVKNLVLLAGVLVLYAGQRLRPANGRLTTS